uniref:DUF1618 domain-containing protein n=1 Tax=Oryza punctata TaxID=4537 RepID=A0A0E0LQ31_ORYPU
MSSKRVQDRDEYRCGGSKRPRPAPVPEKRKHLYLMLDDRDNAYRMHKIDVDALADSEDDDMLRLPEPALLQLATSTARHDDMWFSALGTSIFAARLPHTPAIVYDTDTGGLTVGPPLPVKLCGGPNITMAMAAGDNKQIMYALYDHDTNYLNPHPMEAMSWEAVPCNDPRERHLPPDMEWTWKSVPSQPPYGRLDEIVSYAVHPDQRTFFISVKEAFCQNNGAKGTFSFDTKKCEWRWHGDWMLPFRTQGYYDAELDAWVGLRVTDGLHVCACRVASRGSSAADAPPEWKLLKEKLICAPASSSATGASLVYMQGSGSVSSRFCLLHREAHVNGCLLRLTIFGLKYDHRGELQASIHRTKASYVVSNRGSFFSPVAFWM